MTTVTTARPLRAPGGSALRDVATMVGREVRRSVRGVDALVTSLVIPVGMMVMFVVVFGGALAPGGAYIDYVVPGVLVLCLGFGAGTTAIPVAQDVHSGTIDRLRTMAIFRHSVLWGHVVASVLRNLVSAGFVLATALALGYRPMPDGGGGWLAVVGFAALVVLVLTWISAAAGLVLSVEAAGVVNVIFLFAPYVSSGFVPVETLPAWLQGYAEHQPFTPVIETLRALLSGGQADSAGVALAWLLAVGAIAYLATVALFGRRSRR